MKTAVEWMANELLYLDNEFDMGFIIKTEYQIKRKSIIGKTKEMEKEKIKQVVIGTYLDLKMKNHGLPHGIEYYNLLAKTEEEAEQYYNETFKTK